jgi:3-phosphoshikimate 1-carboxyvinyltransferase
MSEHKLETLTVGPFTHAKGDVTLPGSKSISNRTLLLAALCEGETLVKNLLKSDDTDVMLAALAKLGVVVEAVDDGYRVTGCGGVFPVKEADLFLGNAGTAFRPLTAALAFQEGHYRLSGVPRMHERPIGDLVDALNDLGAQISYQANSGFPPLDIHALKSRALKSQNVCRVKVRGDVSSQFLTALLMTLPLLKDNIVIEVVGELISKPYIDITLNMMAKFGIHVERRGWREFVIPASARYVSPEVIHVEGDASSASYFLAAGAIGGGPVRVHGVGNASIQGDVKFADSLAQMGARIEMGENWISASAPASGRLRAIDADFNHIPDAAMTIAAAALFADGTTTLRNIASWRVKETDRISAMATELRKFGATVEEGSDYLRVTPPAGNVRTPTASIDTYDDHRMAMCFSLPSLGGVPVNINDPKCVAKTFPDYFGVFAAIASRRAEKSGV